MLNTYFRRKYSAFLKRRFVKKSNSYSDNDLKKSALIVAPHFDDETLGCGGIVSKKKKSGAKIKIVFMTDGSQSHSSEMENKKLNTIRTQEALNAAAELGLKIEDVIIFNHSDSKLEENLNEAEKEILDLLNSIKPQEIYIPSKKEPWIYSGDHLATTKICLKAIEKFDSSITIYEYPVWYWYSFPWVSLPFKTKKTTKQILKISVNGKFGFGLLNDFNTYFDLNEFSKIKINALEKHESQMKSPDGAKNWNTLRGVSNGEFLSCFFNKIEVFNKTILNKSLTE